MDQLNTKMIMMKLLIAIVSGFASGVGVRSLFDVFDFEHQSPA